MFAPVHAHEGLFGTDWPSRLSIHSRFVVAGRRSQVLSRTHLSADPAPTDR